MDVFWTLPPVTRTITAAAVVVSALGYAHIIDLTKFIFIPQYVFTTKMAPQVWRLVTGFFITKRNMAIALDPYFLYQYGSGLERESSRFSQPGDFFVYTAFVGSFIAVSSLFVAPCVAHTFSASSDNPDYLPAQLLLLKRFLNSGESTLAQYAPRHSHNPKGVAWCVSMVGMPFEKHSGLAIPPCARRLSLTRFKVLAGYVLGAWTFLPALTLAYAYTYAQDNPTRQVSFFILTFDAKYLPFALIFLTMIMENADSALAQATGLLAAHLFDFLTRIWPTFGGGSNYITTPATVKRWFGGGPGTQQARGYGFAQAARSTAEPPAAGRTTGAAPQWGPGRRLGE
ncbi:centromere/microtubule-binding protein cbf5 [Paraphaeosphaeria minitans]|uniref:Derlin n=1 Tax=Paraphaeosphaeria minitans TaxID=565426 RepID=A0A9P6GFM8_9PLEO|nr:centromere/microtubule-binding protein cbf5 [Paraphaeosphaeria minitans]